MKALMPIPEVPILQCKSHFAKLFEGNVALVISTEITAKLSQIKHMPFNPNEIQILAKQMKSRYSLELATFYVKHFLITKMAIYSTSGIFVQLICS